MNTPKGIDPKSTFSFNNITFWFWILIILPVIGVGLIFYNLCEVVEPHKVNPYKTEAASSLPNIHPTEEEIFLYPGPHLLNKWPFIMIIKASGNYEFAFITEHKYKYTVRYYTDVFIPDDHVGVLFYHGPYKTAVPDILEPGTHKIDLVSYEVQVIEIETPLQRVFGGNGYGPERQPAE